MGLSTKWKRSPIQIRLTILKDIISKIKFKRLRGDKQTPILRGNINSRTKFPYEEDKLP
jgi:hypothetical protein